MTDDPSNLPETPNLSEGLSPTSTGVPVAGSTSGRSLGARSCPKCGSRISVHASVCPECGESLKDQGGSVRCRHCGQRSPAELTLCAHCGRELESAPSRLISWGVPAALVVLFLIIVVRQVDGTNPVTWAQGRLNVDRLASRETATRGLVVVVTPAAGDVQTVAESSPVEQTAPDAVRQQAVSEATAETVISPASVEEAEVSVPEEPITEGPDTANSEQNAEIPLEAVESVAEESETQPENAEALAPTLTPAATMATAVTETPTAAPSAPDPAESIRVAAASLANDAAPALPSATPTQAATATTNATSTPTQTQTPAPTDTATPVPMPTYEIRRGDTLVVIARRNNVTVEDLMRVNGITAAAAFTIQPGQELLIPVEGSVGAQEPTPVPTETPTATIVVPPTATPLPTPTTPALRLDAPMLRSPESGTPVSCARPTSLVWLPVPFMRADDKFVLHLGFVNGRMEDGRDVVIWVLEQPRPANVTSWDMDGSLCSLAPQEYQRKWHWYVEVVEEADGVTRPVSPPSETWTFTWN